MYLFGVLVHQCMYETIHNVIVVQKRLMQTWFDFDQDIIGATSDQSRDRIRSCVRTGSGHFEHML